jgi:hypothetical protein
MFQARMLSRAEGLLRHPSTGSANLAAAPDEWHLVAPRFADERFDVGALGMTIAGGGLLTNLASFGGSGGAIEIAVDLSDGYGGVRDMVGLTPHVVSAAADWAAGTFDRSFADIEAGARSDATDRVGLRGLPVASPAASPASAAWTSAPIDLRYGTEIVAACWEGWAIRDPAGNSIGVPTFELRTGTRGPGAAIAWSAFNTAAATAAAFDAGYRDLPSAIAGDVFQWRITLPYVDPGVVAAVGETVLRTATLFSLCAWVRLAAPRWRFASLGEIIDRSEMSRHVATAGWDGSDDAVIVRLPLSAALRGAHRELLRARVTSAAAASLGVVEIHAVADLRFDRAEG